MRPSSINNLDLYIHRRMLYSIGYFMLGGFMACSALTLWMCLPKSILSDYLPAIRTAAAAEEPNYLRSVAVYLGTSWEIVVENICFLFSPREENILWQWRDSFIENFDLFLDFCLESSVWKRAQFYCKQVCVFFSPYSDDFLWRFFAAMMCGTLFLQYARIFIKWIVAYVLTFLAKLNLVPEERVKRKAERLRRELLEFDQRQARYQETLLSQLANAEAEFEKLNEKREHDEDITADIAALFEKICTHTENLDDDTNMMQQNLLMFVRGTFRQRNPTTTTKGMNTIMTQSPLRDLMYSPIQHIRESCRMPHPSTRILKRPVLSRGENCNIRKENNARNTR